MERGSSETWCKLVELRQPAAIWRAMVRAEPYLVRYDEACRKFDTRGLILRIERIMREIASRDSARANSDNETYVSGAYCRDGLTFEAAELLESKLADTCRFISQAAAFRKPSTTEPSFTPETIVVCDACWRLTPVSSQRGFRKDGPAVRALCAIHSPAADVLNAPALRAARRRMKTISSLDLPTDVSIRAFANIFAEGAGRTNDPFWSMFLRTHFPHVAQVYPDAHSNIRATFAALDGRDNPKDRHLLYDALLAPCPSKKQKVSQMTKTDREADLLNRATPVTTHFNRGANLLYAMLRTRELWLLLDKVPFHGGPRPGAGRPRKKDETAYCAKDAM